MLEKQSLDPVSGRHAPRGTQVDTSPGKGNGIRPVDPEVEPKAKRRCFIREPLSPGGQSTIEVRAAAVFDGTRAHVPLCNNREKANDLDELSSIQPKSATLA
jgi:hypothetical protein